MNLTSWKHNLNHARRARRSGNSLVVVVGLTLCGLAAHAAAGEQVPFTATDIL